MTIIRGLYTIYATLLFIVTFIIAFPFFAVLSLNKSWHKSAYLITHYWGRMLFFLLGFKVKVENRNTAAWQKPCIYVANHFSYSDIAAIPQFTKDACFVGKQSIQKVPLFGYYFKSLHITVNRESLRDRAQVYERSMEALDDGKSLIIFPEGGIRTTDPPQQIKYKDGAFKMAIDRQIPIVPITLPYNWKILPDEKVLLLRGNKMEIIVHEAINTAGLTHKDEPSLKENVFNIIQHELNIKNKVSPLQIVNEN